MKAHVEDGSKRGDEDVAPFYVPAPHVSGPDICILRRDQRQHLPLFCPIEIAESARGQLCRESACNCQQSSHTEEDGKGVRKGAREGSKRAQETAEGAEEATETSERSSTSSAQSNLSDQQQSPRLQDYFPTGTYISMVITYTAEFAKLQVVQSDLSRKLMVFYVFQST